MRIKKENEWKGVFTIYVGSFKPIVMFFCDDKFTSYIPGNNEWNSEKHN